MDEEHHIAKESTMDDVEYSLILEVSENDPLFDKKKILLEAVGDDPKGNLCFKSSICPNSLNLILQRLLQKARIINMDELDLYFSGVDIARTMGFCSLRNEMESLHSILSLIDKSISSCNLMKVNDLQALRNATLDMIHKFENEIREETKVVTNCRCDMEKSLLQWGESNGVVSKLDIAYVQGAGRGAIASQNLNVGDIALEIPVSVIISEKSVNDSDMFSILENVDGISSETMMLLWSMKEKYNPYSKFKLYFDTLPEVFNTGLSFAVDAIMALDGTLLLEEIVQAKEHLHSQYEELFPSLWNDYPEMFPPELYTWEKFLWACELWYSNSMKVMFTDGSLRTCLIPIAGFLNHSICPHIMQYGKVDSTTNTLKFPLSRSCNAGEECFLSYGNLSSSHLLTFYGFLPQGDNPSDIIPLDIDIPQIDPTSEDASCLMSDWNTHMVRGTWLSKNHDVFHYGLPPPLLDSLRRARSPTLQKNILTQQNLEVELEILEDLGSTFEDMLLNLGETKPEDSENSSWDVNLALEFKDLQRRIISSIVSSCHAGRKLVEHELNKCTSQGD